MCPPGRLLLVGAMGSTGANGEAFRKLSKWPCGRVKPPSAARQGGRQPAEASERCGAEKSGPGARAMAPTPWRGRHRRRPKEGTRVSFRDAQSFRARSRRPERLGLDTVVLHLEVEGLVVHAQESRGLTLVPPRGLKGQADRLPLRLGGGPAGDLLQGGAHFFSQPSHHGSS